MWQILLCLDTHTLMSGQLPSGMKCFNTSTLVSKSHVATNSLRLTNEGTVHSRVMPLNWIFMDDWNMDIREMAVVPGDRQNQTILQQSTDSFQIRGKYAVCFCFFQPDGCLVTSLPQLYYASSASMPDNDKTGTQKSLHCSQASLGLVSCASCVS